MFEVICFACGKPQTPERLLTTRAAFACVRCETSLSLLDCLPTIELEEFELDPAIVALIPRDVAEKHQAIAVNRAGSTIIVAMARPTTDAVEQLAQLTAHNIEPVLALPTSIRTARAKYYAED